jgi:DNA/RNA endonuclease YhcR with UshA esterase domain
MLLASAGLALLLATAADADVIGPSDAAQHIGEMHTVKGLVAQVSTSGKGTVFLNFGGRFPNHVFYGVVFAEEAARFPNMTGLEGRSVTLTGEISLYDGKPQIILSDPSQVAVSE